ncbi:MAG: NUDIX domain-containing protein [Phycisphaerae bacterium]|nr:NUDIX domain-containing protein [Tepidisphaeraceae bacterium]
MPTPDFILELRKKVGPATLCLPGVCAVVINSAGQVLLQLRGDLKRWGLLGGILEPGEEPADGVAREVFEEAGVRVEPERITGVYTTPVLTYPNGDRAQYTITTFRCRPVPDGQPPRVNDDESLDVRYFDPAELPADLHAAHVDRLKHALSGDPAAFFTRRG